MPILALHSSPHLDVALPTEAISTGHWQASVAGISSLSRFLRQDCKIPIWTMVKPEAYGKLKFHLSGGTSQGYMIFALSQYHIANK